MPDPERGKNKSRGGGKARGVEPWGRNLVQLGSPEGKNLSLNRGSWADWWENRRGTRKGGQ